MRSWWTSPVTCVRHAVAADADAIGETHGSSWAAAYVHIFDASFLAAAAQSRRVGWRDSISRIQTPPNVLLVAEVDGKVCAFAHGVPRPQEVNSAEIRAFFARPDVWGSGVAARLMQDLCRVLRDGGIREVALWTPRDAHRARGFYEKVGFTLTGSSRTDQVRDWTSGEDAELAEVEYATRL
jgi:GNAT superfamily N-acetyltransferase